MTEPAAVVLLAVLAGLVLVVNHVVARLTYAEVGFTQGLPDIARPDPRVVDATALIPGGLESALILFATPECTACRSLLDHLHDVEGRLPVPVVANVVERAPDCRLPSDTRMVRRRTIEAAGLTVFPYVVLIGAGAVLDHGPIGRAEDLDALVGQYWSALPEPVARRGPGTA